MGFFSKLKEGLKKTKDSMVKKMQKVVNSFTKIDEELFESLEETMIMSDMGVETSEEICQRLRKRIKEEGVTDPSLIMGLIQDIIREMLGTDTELDIENKPAIIMVIGVNGAGKTTTIGKLCHQYKEQGKRVIVAAADTFRAAAIDQLEVWTERAGVEIVKHSEGSDPASVVFDGISAAKARNADILICDVPCSGLGILGRKADIRYNASAEKTEALVELQRRILSVCSEYVRPGGYLIYSTCTINSAENENNVAWFTANYPYETDSIEKDYPMLQKDSLAKGYVQLLPGIDNTDGFFIARLKKKDVE